MDKNKKNSNLMNKNQIGYKKQMKDTFIFWQGEKREYKEIIKKSIGANYYATMYKHHTTKKIMVEPF